LRSPIAWGVGKNKPPLLNGKPFPPKTDHVCFPFWWGFGGKDLGQTHPSLGFPFRTLGVNSPCPLYWCPFTTNQHLGGWGETDTTPPLLKNPVNHPFFVGGWGVWVLFHKGFGVVGI